MTPPDGAAPPLDRRGVLKFAAGLAGSVVLGPNALLSDRKKFDVRAFGATGNGRTSDTAGVNLAIEAASAAGGGTVTLSPGVYRCDTIHLASQVDLHLERGATIMAAPPGGYDAAEPNPWGQYQDFGHDHFHNALICGHGVHDVSINGPGLIWGMGLSRDSVPIDGTPSDLTHGVADKVISLKNCRNVTLRGFSILGTGHFGVLATGVDNLTIDGLRIDTTRDGINIDSCWGAQVTGCVLNTPNDDSICLKASYALGSARGTRDVVIRDCWVTGAFRVGTLLDGSCERLPEGVGRLGRIKLGTESDGDFTNIRIENCALRDCLGLALETVDGGRMRNVTVSGVTMRNLRNAPFFLRLGARLRAPPGTPVGAIDGVRLEHLQCYGFKEPAIICGIPGHPIRNVTIDDVYLVQSGGHLEEEADIVPPERVALYPETSMFGKLPARLLYLRHVEGLTVSDVDLVSREADTGCPFIWADNVEDDKFIDVRLPAHVRSPKVFRYETARAPAVKKTG
jgi:polygalacturonase